MSIAKRRLYLAAAVVFLLVVALLTSIQKAEPARAAWRCPAPVITWDMISKWPHGMAAAMGSSWIEPEHRPAGGMQRSGTMDFVETTQYRWCMDGKRPKFTGHIQAYRTCLAVRYTGWVPSGVQNIKWNTQGVYWPSLTAGKRQWYRTGETTWSIAKSKSWLGRWQNQCRAISAPWVPIHSHPQRQVWGHVSLEAAKDKGFHMYDNDRWLPFSPATDKRYVIFG